MSEIDYEMIEKLGVLSTSKSGWSKELNLIRWNGREPKYDLCDWSADHEKMGNPAQFHGGAQGITLSAEELSALKELFSNIERD